MTRRLLRVAMLVAISWVGCTHESLPEEPVTPAEVDKKAKDAEKAEEDAMFDDEPAAGAGADGTDPGEEDEAAESFETTERPPSADEWFDAVPENVQEPEAPTEAAPLEEAGTDAPRSPPSKVAPMPAPPGSSGATGRGAPKGSDCKKITRFAERKKCYEDALDASERAAP